MQAPSLLSVQTIQSLLTTQSLGRRIELHSHIDSTNREAMALAETGGEHGTVVLADSQTEGKGRLSRRWFSPPGVNVYCSIVIKNALAMQRPSDWLSWLPLMTALASAEAIEVIAGTHTAVKWPNDLLIGDSKVGGILCESGTDVQSRPFQVIGIGVNVNGTPADFPENLRGPATTIRHESGRFIDRNKLVAQLLHELEVCIEEYVSGGFERVSHAYRQRCSTIGKTVQAILTDGKEFVGLAETIGKDGSLRVVQRRVPPDQRPPRVRELRAADIIHLRS